MRGTILTGQMESQGSLSEGGRRVRIKGGHVRVEAELRWLARERRIERLENAMMLALKIEGPQARAQVTPRSQKRQNRILPQNLQKETADPTSCLQPSKIHVGFLIPI